MRCGGVRQQDSSAACIKRPCNLSPVQAGCALRFIAAHLVHAALVLSILAAESGQPVWLRGHGGKATAAQLRPIKQDCCSGQGSLWKAVRHLIFCMGIHIASPPASAAKLRLQNAHLACRASAASRTSPSGSRCSSACWRSWRSTAAMRLRSWVTSAAQPSIS